MVSRLWISSHVLRAIVGIAALLTVVQLTVSLRFAASPSASSLPSKIAKLPMADTTHCPGAASADVFILNTSQELCLKHDDTTLSWAALGIAVRAAVMGARHHTEGLSIGFTRRTEAERHCANRIADRLAEALATTWGDSAPIHVLAMDCPPSRASPMPWGGDWVADGLRVLSQARPAIETPWTLDVSSGQEQRRFWLANLHPEQHESVNRTRHELSSLPFAKLQTLRVTLCCAAEHQQPSTLLMDAALCQFVMTVAQGGFGSSVAHVSRASRDLAYVAVVSDVLVMRAGSLLAALLLPLMKPGSAIIEITSPPGESPGLIRMMSARFFHVHSYLIDRRTAQQAEHRLQCNGSASAACEDSTTRAARDVYHGLKTAMFPLWTSRSRFRDIHAFDVRQ